MHPDNGRRRGRKRQEGRQRPKTELAGSAELSTACHYCAVNHQRGADTLNWGRGRRTPHESPISQGFQIHMFFLHPKSSSPLRPSLPPPLPSPSDPQFVISISPLSRRAGAGGRYCEKPALLPSSLLSPSPLSFCVSLLGFHLPLPLSILSPVPHACSLRVALRYDAVNSMQTNVQDSSLFSLYRTPLATRKTEAEVEQRC